jgi:Predicted membrane protein
VELVNSNGLETEVTVNANDGTVLENETEEQYEENEEYVAPGNVGLSEQEAIDIATAEANGTVEEVELESEYGTPAYEVELVNSNGLETEVTVNANDGTVLEIETEDD